MRAVVGRTDLYSGYCSRPMPPTDLSTCNPSPLGSEKPSATRPAIPAPL